MEITYKTLNQFLALITIFIVLALLAGCGETSIPELKSENGYYQVLITEEAGSFTFPTEDGKTDSIKNYFPLPVSFGHFSVNPIDSLNPRIQINAFVLDGGAHKGEVKEVMPIAVYKMTKDIEVIPIVLAVPVSKKNRLIDATSYYEFQKECFTCKSILEEWIIHFPHFQDRIFVGWENEKQAEKLLEAYAKVK